VHLVHTYLRTKGKWADNRKSATGNMERLLPPRTTRPRGGRTHRTRASSRRSSVDAAGPVGHEEHHKLIGEAINSLVENVNELNKQVETKIEALTKRIEEVAGDIGAAATAAYDNKEELTEIRSHIEELWPAVGDAAGRKKAGVEKRRTELENRLEDRNEEMKRRLSVLAEGPSNTEEMKEKFE